jgi:hypothetical protein
MDDLKKVYYWGLLFFIVLFLLLQMYWYFYPDEDINKVLYRKIELRDIKSTILRRGIDKKNHGVTYIIYGKDSLPTHTGWNEKIEIGDSIIKPKGSLKLIIKNSRKIDTLDYEKNEEEIIDTNF